MSIRCRFGFHRWKAVWRGLRPGEPNLFVILLPFGFDFRFFAFPEGGKKIDRWICERCDKRMAP